jgi:hypothetical protein
MTIYRSSLMHTQHTEVGKHHTEAVAQEQLPARPVPSNNSDEMGLLWIMTVDLDRVPLSQQDLLSVFRIFRENCILLCRFHHYNSINWPLEQSLAELFTCLLFRSRQHGRTRKIFYLNITSRPTKAFVSPTLLHMLQFI